MGALLIIVALVLMDLAYLYLLYAGFIAGEASDAAEPLGIGPLVLCVVMMLAQAGGWLAVGLHLGAVA